MTNRPNPIHALRVLLALLALTAIWVAAPAEADDRDLVREGGRVPYLMVIFDVSGSMNWQPGGDGFAPGYGDDPNSKFYQAKSALFRVVDDPELDDIFWGFSTYNQDSVRAYRKHWLYTPSGTLPWVADDRLPYPAPGNPKHFGDNCMDDSDGDTNCDLDGNDTLGSCGGARNVDTAESWGEILTFPVAGDTGTWTSDEWVRHDGRRFRVRYSISSGNYGDEVIQVRTDFREAANDCSVWLTGTTSRTIDWERVYPADLQGRNLPGGNEVLYWQIDDRNDSSGNPNGFFNPDDTRATNTCAGWDPNNDTGPDDTLGVNLKYPTTSDPDGRHSSVMDRGDVIPLDWESEEVWGVSNKDLILQRLAPNYDLNDTSIVPDFRVAPYFQDNPNTLFNGRLELKPQFVNTPPLLPNGSTPIGNSMRDFMNHYDVWEGVASGADGDEFFGCRSVNLLIITDGDETCYGGGLGGQTDGNGDANPCWVAQQLLDQNDRDIRTFVIGFGLQGQATNFLDCIAENGGTDEIDTDGDGITDVTGPILPGNEDELVDALKSIIQTIRAQERSFAAAAVPQGQATVEEKAYLTSFLPLEDESVWPGRLDSYLRTDSDPQRPTSSCPTAPRSPARFPTPTTPAIVTMRSRVTCGTPARSCSYRQQPTPRSCSATTTSDTPRTSGESSTAQAPASSVPEQRLDFERPTTDPGWEDLLTAMDICDAGDAACALDSANRTEATDTLDFFHMVKTSTDPRTSDPIDYLLGDIFHSDPAVMGNPDTFRYWVADVAGSGTLPLDDICTESPGGYRCFFAKQQNRRKMLVAGSDDGQLHAFDAGVFRGSCETSPLTGQEFVTGEFDNGTGREIFSIVPRTVMPDLVTLKDNLDHQFTVDGRVSFGDVHIDPAHNGTPDEDEREWRSVLMSGLREGGSAYFAIDLTQPDDLDFCGGIPVLPNPAPGADSFIPSCVDGSCGDTIDFASILWEFTDTEDCGVDGTGDPKQLASGACDSDENGLADMGDAWSRPVITRIQLLEDVGGTLEPIDKYVAIFGGGSDPGRKGAEEAEGNHMFMIDIETGKAIYKRRVPQGLPGVPSGAVASDVAAVDLDQNGYTDTVYFGTTGGFMYKMKIGLPQELEAVNGAGLKVTDTAWDPFPVFNTEGRPIYFEPAVVFVADAGQYALAFGTGDREDLWNFTGASGRVYMILDTNWSEPDVTSGILPMDEGDYQPITFGSLNTDNDYLRFAPHGWYIALDDDERVITRAFSLAGVTVISSFQPIEDTEGNGVCRRFGNSRVTVVTSTSGNALLTSGERFFLVEAGFLSTPFAEVDTKAPDPDDPGSDPPIDFGDMLSEIKKLFPKNCRFANYTIDIKAVRDDTGIELLAAVPVCTFETNWRDF